MKMDLNRGPFSFVIRLVLSTEVLVTLVELLNTTS